MVGSLAECLVVPQKVEVRNLPGSLYSNEKIERSKPTRFVRVIFSVEGSAVGSETSEKSEENDDKREVGDDEPTETPQAGRKRKRAAVKKATPPRKKADEKKTKTSSELELKLEIHEEVQYTLNDVLTLAQQALEKKSEVLSHHSSLSDEDAKKTLLESEAFPDLISVFDARKEVAPFGGILSKLKIVRVDPMSLDLSEGPIVFGPKNIEQLKDKERKTFLAPEGSPTIWRETKKPVTLAEIEAKLQEIIREQNALEIEDSDRLLEVPQKEMDRLGRQLLQKEFFVSIGDIEFGNRLKEAVGIGARPLKDYVLWWSQQLVMADSACYYFGRSI
jgi:hypothetical protein